MKDRASVGKPRTPPKTHGQYMLDIQAKHGNRYDHSQVVYTRGVNRITVICREHGAFTPTAHSYLRGSGCPKCMPSRKSNRVKMTRSEFIAAAKEIHGDRYDYGPVLMLPGSGRVLIWCPQCKVNFHISPADHLRGDGCPYCS